MRGAWTEPLIDEPWTACYPAEWHYYAAEGDSIVLKPFDFGRETGRACDKYLTGDCYFGVTDAVAEAYRTIVKTLPSTAVWLKRGVNKALQFNAQLGWNTILVKNWAYTSNTLTYGRANPEQTLHAIRFVINTDSSVSYSEVKSIDVTVNGKAMGTIPNGGMLSIDSLKQFFELGELPTPVIESRRCAPDDMPEITDFEYIIKSCPDDLAGYNGIEHTQDLEIVITKIELVDNAYRDALPEDLK